MKILSQKGMSMVQVLIGSAMVAGIALVLAQLGLDSSKVQRSSMINAEIVQISNMVEKLMLNNQACVNTFSPEGAIAQNTPENNPIIIENIMDFGTPTDPAPGRIIYARGSDIGGNLTLTNITARRGGSTSAWPSNEIRLFLTLTKKNEDEVRRSMGAQTIVKTFNINARFDASNNVTHCYSDLDGVINEVLRFVCESPGFHNQGAGAWNTTTQTCPAPGGVTVGSFHRIQNQPPLTIPGVWDYCALSRTGGEDGYKDSTARHCIITNPSAGQWVLDSWLEEGRTNRCSAMCFRL